MTLKLHENLWNLLVKLLLRRPDCEWRAVTGLNGDWKHLYDLPSAWINALKEHDPKEIKRHSEGCFFLIRKAALLKKETNKHTNNTTKRTRFSFRHFRKTLVSRIAKESVAARGFSVQSYMCQEVSAAKRGVGGEGRGAQSWWHRLMPLQRTSVWRLFPSRAGVG